MIKVIDKKDSSEVTFDNLEEVIEYTGFGEIKDKVESKLSKTKEFSYMSFIILVE